MLGNRSFRTVLGAICQPRHYRAAANMLSKYETAGEAFWRYLTGNGDYPWSLVVHTPNGNIRPTLYSHHDLLTVNEIFCRKDYDCPRDSKIIVDFGSNIGISALFFLTHCPAASLHLFEPLPQNCERLQVNLEGFGTRYQLNQYAVGLADGPVTFGYEDSGRYGGVGRALAKSMTVQCRRSNQVLDEILAAHGFIDVLKVDIETMERDVVQVLGTRAERIGLILVEQSFRKNPLPTHTYRQYGSVARFTLRRLR